MSTLIRLLMTGAAAAALWYGWHDALPLLRDTWAFDVRHILFAVGATLVLSLAEAIATRLTARLTPPA